MKVAFHTLGCKVNQYETEAMREQFVEAGFESVDENDFADVYVINTCTVTNLADRKSRQYIRRMKKGNPKAIIAVTGCYAQIKPEELISLPEVDVVAGTGEKNNIISYVQKFMEEHQKQTHIIAYDDLCEYQDKGIITSMESRTRAYIKIQEGCDRFCSYCLIPFARGKVRSRDPQEIVDEAKALIDKGFKEIILTGINTALYGREEGFADKYKDWIVGTGIELRDDEKDADKSAAKTGAKSDAESGAESGAEAGVKLLAKEGDGMEAIIKTLNELPGEFRIRLSSLEPAVINADYVDRLMKYDKLCHHLHLSAQSGSDHVLELMNRPYGQKDYLDIVKVLRDKDPLYGISTDIIVGFPQETEEDFQDSVDLVEAAGFCKVHAFRYSKRGGTAAAVMKGQVASETKNLRVNKLIEAGDKAAADFANKCIGKTRTVLFEEWSGEYITGYTDNYIKVYAKGTDNDLNCFREVKLLEIYEDGMKGEL